MAVVGEGNLKELFPNFKDDVEANGFDMRVGKVYQISEDSGHIGCVNGDKLKPDYVEVPVLKTGEYKLNPHEFYFIEIDRPICIPDGYIQNYYMRSTFARCGLILTDGIADNGFNGVIRVGVYVASPVPIYMGRNEKIIQAETLTTDDTVGKYDGSYQNDKFYKKE